MLNQTPAFASPASASESPGTPATPTERRLPAGMSAKHENSVYTQSTRTQKTASVPARMPTFHMRIIAGLYGGRILKSPADNRTRPTSDRLRETLFNVLAPRIGEDTRFLDLCAGSGAVGIEAISRGAAFATFVDKSRKACALIEENLDFLQVPEAQTEIVGIAAETFSAREHPEGWDIVFFDPPYQLDYAAVLFEFGQPESTLLRDNGLLVAEHHAKTPLPDAVGLLRRWRILKQGESTLSFYERN